MAGRRSRFCFDRFDETLRNAGFLAMGGQIVDVTIIAAPSCMRICESNGRCSCME